MITELIAETTKFSVCTIFLAELGEFDKIVWVYSGGGISSTYMKKFVLQEVLFSCWRGVARFVCVRKEEHFKKLKNQCYRAVWSKAKSMKGCIKVWKSFAGHKDKICYRLLFLVVAFLILIYLIFCDGLMLNILHEFLDVFFVGDVWLFNLITLYGWI